MASMNPHIRSDYSPLEELVMQALRRHGEFTPSTVDGDVSLMMLEFANEVLEEINSHPYWTGSQLKPYTALQDVREAPDNIIVLGLVLHYSSQQGSSKDTVAAEKYFRTMNQTFYRMKHGTERPTFNQDFR